MKLAYYDPSTDTIHNCKEGSFNWVHETRHKEQYKNKLIDKIDTYTHLFGYYLSFIVILFALIFTNPLIVLLCGFTWLPYTIFCLILEIDANVYAFKKMRLK